MSELKFSKMNGAGNDYVFILEQESLPCNLSALSIKLSNRHTGIGSDGLVIISKSEIADWKMRIFNADGSEAEMCGNAACCVALFLYSKSLIPSHAFTLETLAGIKNLRINYNNTVTIDMGEPVLTPAEIPFKAETNQAELVINSHNINLTAVSMGNPHGVVFCEDVDDCHFEEIGEGLQKHQVFPNGANIEFVEILNQNNIKIRILERGSGETMACGTGASASTVAACLAGKCGRSVDVHQRGGTTHIEWSETDNHVYLTGSPEFSFEGFVQV